MRVFMLGWEFPPHISGGLGTACHGLTKGLDALGVDVLFVLPTAVPVGEPSHVTFRSPADAVSAGVLEGEEEVSTVSEHVELHKVSAVLSPYGTPETHDRAVRRLISKSQKVAKARGDAAGTTEAPQMPPLPAGTFVGGMGANYEGDLMGQVAHYARLAVEIARREEFDVIHAHDWMTYVAGQAVKAATGKPLVVQVHSTEFDRSGQNVDQRIYDVERMGMHTADKVVCVSHLTRSIVLSRYAVPPDKVEVVYNAVSLPETREWEMKPIRQNEKIVLFLGRVTMQKGPEYFLQAARKVVDKFQDVRFVMAGSGDMISRCIREAADLKLGRYVTFTGFLRGHDVDRIFQMADLYVMPSVSEPFGIAPLEALSHNVPVIISKQSGVSEILTHALKVDFWDTSEMANKILAVLRHPPLQKALRHHGQIEMRKLSWRDSAKRLLEIYRSVT